MASLFPEPKDGPFFVVNIRYYQGDYVYMGRAGHGQDGTFGNPYRKEDHGEQALVMFDELFPKLVRDDAVYNRKLYAILYGQTRALGCFCKKKDGSGRCHVDPIARWLNKKLDEMQQLREARD